MNLLQVFNRYLEKGGEEIWVDEFQKLASENHSVETLFFDSGDWQDGSPFDRLKQARLMWNNPSSREKLAQSIKKQKAEVLIFHNVLPVGSFGLYQEARDLGVPIYQYTHNFRPFSPSGTLWVNGEVEESAMYGKMRKEIAAGAWGGSKVKTALMAFYFKKFIRSGMINGVTHWLAISKFMRERFVEAGIAPEKISTLRHCRSVEEISEPAPDDGYYLFLGRLVPEKGCLMLVKAWINLEEKLGENCPTLIIAGVGPSKDEMESLAGNSQKIKFTGFVSGEKKESLLRGCRALLAPSIWWEPLGLVAYDGYQYGKPVVAARSGGLTEIIEEGKGGLLHQPGSTEDFCDQIVALEKMTPTERETMGMTGHRWLRVHANPEEWRKQLDAILSL